MSTKRQNYFTPKSVIYTTSTERKVIAPVGKPIITTRLIRKLSRAKRRAYNKNNRDAWKYLAKQLAEEQKNVL